MIRWFKFVPLSDVALWESAGWCSTGALIDTHHGAWSDLMEWAGSGEPISPLEDTGPPYLAESGLED